MKYIQFKPRSDTYGITGTSKQVSIYASFMDLETMFGQPAFEGKGDKVTTEFVVDYHADGERSTFTIYDYHYTRNFGRPEEIIDIFTTRRITIVKRRYELLAKDAQERITQNNEIIRFIKERHYAQAEKSANRKAFVDYLKKSKFITNGLAN